MTCYLLCPFRSQALPSCDAGSGIDRRASPTICVPCKPGHFSPGDDVQNCLPCYVKGEYWQNETGSSSCKACPTHTRRLQGGDGVSVSECVCKAMFYAPGLEPSGAPCEPCPDGGICLGNRNESNVVPYPMPGYATFPSPLFAPFDHLYHYQYHCHGVVSDHQCVLPYKQRAILEMLLNLIKLC